MVTLFMMTQLSLIPAHSDVLNTLHVKANLFLIVMIDEILASIRK